MPDISAYTTPLSDCVRIGHPFEWTPLLDKCFESIKTLACKAPILKPIDNNDPNPIWVITDGSKTGVGAIYGQGPDWKACWPAGFLSKKFSNAQQYYRTHKHNTIAMLEALMKWEDKLLGHRFTLVTDHKGLEYFKTQKNLLDRQVWWWEFLSRLNFTIMHVDGVDNKVVDCLSCYYENDTSDDAHSDNAYINTDIQLDPDGKLLPTDHYMKLHAAVIRWSKCLAKRQESHHIKAEILNDGDKELLPSENTSSADDITAIAAGNDNKSLWTHVEEMMDLWAIIKNAYCKDMICAKIIIHQDAHPRFSLQEGLIWMKNQLKHDVICIPQDTFQRGRRLIKIIIDNAHQIIGHYSQWKTSNYIQHSYWWPQMATNIEAFCRLCGKCQTNKTNTQKLQGLLHSLPIPDKPWQSVGMDFMGPLP